MAKKQRPDPALIKEAVQEAHRLAEIGHPVEAEQIYREVLKLSSTHIEALHGLALLHQQQKRYAEALVLYDRIRVMAPRNPEILLDRGNTLHSLGREHDALAQYDKAIDLAPDHVPSLYNRGNSLLELGRPAEALESFDRALALQPTLVQALSNRGNALRNLGRFEEGLASYETALALRPNDPDILNNRGNALIDLGRDAEAIATFESVLAAVPGFAKARYNMGLAHLRLGNFAAGWEAYEARWGTPAFQRKPRRFAQPLWLGHGPLSGRTLLLHAEQGLGDTIQFVRYLPQVIALAAKVVLEVPQELIGLISAFAGDATLIARGAALPDFDTHCPLMSLPRAFATRLETVPASVPYLSAPPEQAESWRRRLDEHAGSRIGLVWAGRPDHYNDAQRSMALAALDPLFVRKDLSFFSLQKALKPDDAAALAERPQIVSIGRDFANFADTAAAIEALDLVITVDTSVAHLAGAMGKPVWILLPHVPDFRWLMDRPDSPWYPTARLFRQSKPGDWPGVIAAVSAALAAPDLFAAA